MVEGLVHDITPLPVRLVAAANRPHQVQRTSRGIHLNQLQVHPHLRAVLYKLAVVNHARHPGRRRTGPAWAEGLGLARTLGWLWKIVEERHVSILTPPRKLKGGLPSERKHGTALSSDSRLYSGEI